MSSKSYRPWFPDQPFLFAPDPRTWLTEDHLVYFILDLLSTLDVSAIESKMQSKDPRGTRPYSPRLMLGILLYGYCIGVRSSRKLEQLTYQDVGLRVLSAGQHPDHSRISTFRREHCTAFRELFLQVLLLCERAGMMKLGHVAIDGTKLQGNASKHKAMSYGRLQQHEQRLLGEIDEILAQAEKVDGEEDARWGVGQAEPGVPEELRRRETRLAKLQQVKAELEAEARQSRAQTLREQAHRARETAQNTDSETLARRSRSRAERLTREAKKLDAGPEPPPPEPTELPRHRVRARPDGSPAEQAQRNFTDPDSRIMESGGTFQQGYNCQAAVDEHAQIILAAGLSNQSPDNGQLAPMLEQVLDNCGRVPKVTSADAGYWTPKDAQRCEQMGTDAYIATRRQRHTELPPARESQQPVALPAETSRELMQRKLQTPEGKAHYARRKAIVEPVFGQIKEARGIRRFLLRGLEQAAAEWQLICCTHNLLKLFRHQRAVPA